MATGLWLRNVIVQDQVKKWRKNSRRFSSTATLPSAEHRGAHAHRAPPCAATGKIAVNDDRWRAPSAVLFCSGWQFMLVHVVDLDLVIRSRQLLDISIVSL